MNECPECDGRGKVCVQRHDDGYEDEYATCIDCGGTGEIQWPDQDGKEQR